MSIQIDAELRTHIESCFAPLNSIAAARSFPPRDSLSSSVEQWFKKKNGQAINLHSGDVKLFATAAVDMWLRGVHSFLISASLTKSSPVWSSVSAYYASHYCVRAFAHLLGHFQSFRIKKVVRLQFHGTVGKCSFIPKDVTHREHLFYWKLVKGDQNFVTDPLFRYNTEESDVILPEVKHRDWANYCDHLPACLPRFTPLEEETLKSRITFIAGMYFDTPPYPQRAKFPDIETVQILAYHRIVKFRGVLNEVLGDANRFWKVHRNPGWTAEYTNFQLTEQGGISTIPSR